jgi:hypothetical protein
MLADLAISATTGRRLCFVKGAGRPAVLTFSAPAETQPFDSHLRFEFKVCEITRPGGGPRSSPNLAGIREDMHNAIAGCLRGILSR